jgi:hypothetical protein
MPTSVMGGLKLQARYGLFALETQNEEHLAAAKAQLGSR